MILLTAINIVALFEWLNFVLSFKKNWLIALREDEAKTLSNASDGA